jgi:hypothetical protein
MAGVSSIDKLPEIERQRVLKALTEAGNEPDYRGLVRILKLKCSHTALWRYHVAKVKPALARNARKITEASIPKDNDIVHQSSRVIDDNQIDPKREAQSLTRQALTDDPIIAAVIAKRERMERAISKTFDAEQYDTFAKLESVDLKALEMHAKAMQHPGFVASAPQQAGSTTVVCIMPSANDERMKAWRGQVIDVEVEK